METDALAAQENPEIEDVVETTADTTGTEDVAETASETTATEDVAEILAETPETSEPGEHSALNDLKRKDRFKGKVVRIMLAGALVDIGQEVPGVLHISQLSTEKVNRVEDVLTAGQEIDVWVRRVYPKKQRIELTLIEPIGLEWREINKDMVLKGKVTRLETFGVFVDIGAERPGLVHISEMTHDYIKNPGDLVKEGDEIEVKVLNVNRQKRQIKLSMKALEEPPVKVVKEVQKPQPRAEAAEPVEKEEPVPTAMEMALREAMQRSQSTRGDDEKVSKGKGKGKSSNAEFEKILARTLQHKVRTGK